MLKKTIVAVGLSMALMGGVVPAQANEVPQDKYNYTKMVRHYWNHMTPAARAADCAYWDAHPRKYKRLFLKGDSGLTKRQERKFWRAWKKNLNKKCVVING